MATPVISEVVASLFLVVSQLSGYPPPRAMPEIHVLSSVRLQEELCQGPCGVFAYYLDGRGVFIRDDLDVVNDLKSRSILLHELIHHLQHEHQRFTAMGNCERWYAREEEAYRMQNAYLSSMRTATRFAFDFLPARCRELAPASD
ncbi:MAG: hypothetical protein ING70_03990 [Rhodocyclaceae bacterium]|jgi:hypothetical protein|nr:hypothetical protein [Rhodocyclaceae bacterium]MCA3133028.1 hypothetical protein [Rhodocyclaceae bacterium]MCA3144801.1 hypothetical protein [Rhodocyclaceae bacterium]